MGITLALGDLSPEVLVQSPKDAMEGLLGGLSVAFDTTALALTLSILLMFSQFLVSQLESQLLESVDRRTNEEFVGRFHQVGSGHDPYLASVQRMAESVMTSCDELVARQVVLWEERNAATRTEMIAWWENARDELAQLASGEPLQHATMQLVAALREMCDRLDRSDNNAPMRPRRRRRPATVESLPDREQAA